MESVFRALADPSRRLLLDKLFERDGQTLLELTGHLEMSRFGVMKHLAVLETAGLVAPRRVGREKFHYLNPGPIRAIQERWLSKYAARWAEALGSLKTLLEGEGSMPKLGEKPAHVFETYIRTTPDALWRALTSGEWTRRYFFKTVAESDFKSGSLFRYVGEDGEVKVDGTVIEADEPKKLVLAWTFRYDPELSAEGPSRLTFEIEPQGSACKLTIVHEFEPGAKAYDHVVSGWPRIISGLKSVLETGQELDLAS